MEAANTHVAHLSRYMAATQTSLLCRCKLNKLHYTITSLIIFLEHHTPMYVIKFQFYLSQDDFRKIKTIPRSKRRMRRSTSFLKSFFLCLFCRSRPCFHTHFISVSLKVMINKRPFCTLPSQHTKTCLTDPTKP